MSAKNKKSGKPAPFTPPKQFIVAEVSKNWRDGQSVGSPMILSQRFEAVIEGNLKRGYVLRSWQFNQIARGEDLSETIVAVFELA